MELKNDKCSRYTVRRIQSNFLFFSSLLFKILRPRRWQINKHFEFFRPSFKLISIFAYSFIHNVFSIDFERIKIWKSESCSDDFADVKCQPIYVWCSLASKKIIIQQHRNFQWNSWMKFPKERTNTTDNFCFVFYINNSILVEIF